MISGNYFLQKSSFGAFLEKLSDRFDVFVPTKKNNQRFYKKYPVLIDDIIVGEVRPFEPLKAFFSRARETVAEGFKDAIPDRGNKPFAIVGVKACDLKGFKIQDFVFRNSGDQDNIYVKNRDENFIVAADCTCAIDTCYCLALGVEPHPSENFDLNLSQIDTGYVVEVGSEKGGLFVRENQSLFQEVTREKAGERDAQRLKVFHEVEANIRKYAIPHQDHFEGAVERNFNSNIWLDESKTCVECGACTIICPTCHCFLLYDQKVDENLKRFRVWDSCMIKDYARVAGGANPRPKLWMRLRNRFEKKFDFFPKVAKIYACTGCGRCISACPAKIDIRKVLKRLVAGS